MLCLPERLSEEHAEAVHDTPLASPAAHTHLLIGHFHSTK